MARNKNTSKPARPRAEWGIQVRLSDGRRSWYFQDDRHHDDAGRPAERWSRHETQAMRFDDERAAGRIIARMAVNARALEYTVVPLPPLRSLPRTPAKPGERHVRSAGQGA